MKTNKLIYFLLAGLLVAGLSSCNDFLDEQPDNRTIIDSEEKAIKMLVSAYAVIVYFRNITGRCTGFIKCFRLEKQFFIVCTFIHPGIKIVQRPTLQPSLQIPDD